MPKFKIGAPQVTFLTKKKKKFTMTYHSRAAAARSVVAWRKKKGKVLKTGSYSKNKSSKSLFNSKSGMTQRSGRATRKRTY
jgi:hypothetical protein